MSTASVEVLSAAYLNNGSLTVTVVDSTVVVAPLTVRFPAIVTSLGSPIVIVPPDSETVTSLAVPLKVTVCPISISVLELPSEKVMPSES